MKDGHRTWESVYCLYSVFVEDAVYKAKLTCEAYWRNSVPELIAVVQKYSKRAKPVGRLSKKVFERWDRWPWELVKPAHQPDSWTEGILKNFVDLSDVTEDVDEIEKQLESLSETRSKRSYLDPRQQVRRKAALVPSDIKQIFDAFVERAEIPEAGRQEYADEPSKPPAEPTLDGSLGNAWLSDHPRTSSTRTPHCETQTELIVHPYAHSTNSLPTKPGASAGISQGGVRFPQRKPSVPASIKTFEQVSRETPRPQALPLESSDAVNCNDKVEIDIASDDSIATDGNERRPIDRRELHAGQSSMPEHLQAAVFVKGSERPGTNIEKALETLCPGQWLSGTVLDGVARILDKVASTARGYSNKALSSWGVRSPTPSTASVFAPVHDSAHWTLGQIDVKAEKFLCLDSLSSSETNSPSQAEKDWFKFAYRLYPSSVIWARLQPPSAQQESNFDCGIHVMITLIYRFCGLDPPKHYGCGLWRCLVAVLLGSQNPEELPLELRDLQSWTTPITSPTVGARSDDAMADDLETQVSQLKSKVQR